MAQLAIYLEDSLATRLDAAARTAGVSRSRFISELIARELDETLPESFFEVLGKWEDSRSPEEILADIRKGPPQRRRDRIR